MGPLSCALLLLSSAFIILIDDVRGRIRNEDCPLYCVCHEITIRRSAALISLDKATCSGRGLHSVSVGLPVYIQDLDLSNNSINRLQDLELSRAGLTRLQFLNLSFNGISEMTKGAFLNLKELTELDLSYNEIDFIDMDLFYNNFKLSVLRLAGNKFKRNFSPFESLSLRELDLSKCLIKSLDKRSFQGLRELRRIDLSGNAMTQLDQDVFSVMPNLQNLSLGQNPWRCEIMILSLKRYLSNRNIHTDLFCEKPLLAAQIEKIIGMQSIDPEPEIQSIEREPFLPTISKLPSNNKDFWDMDNAWLEDTKVRQEEAPTNSDLPPPNVLPLGTVSPFWFLLIGFLLGSGATMVITYLGLSTTVSCLVPRSRRIETSDSTDASSQRVSLLRHLYNQQDSVNNADDNGNNSGNLGVNVAAMPGSNGLTATSPSCPGTPPPPYREVMLHRNLYPARVALPGRLFDYNSQTTDPVTILRRDYNIGATF